jgi:hypothetical protein
MEGGRWDFREGFEDKLGVGKGGLGILPLDAILVGQSRVRLFVDEGTRDMLTVLYRLALQTRW